MKPLALCVFLALYVTACQSQTTPSAPPSRAVGGPCEGCEALLEYGDKKLSAIDTLPGFLEHEPKLLLSGTVFEQDGTTPAPGVILYIYHTDRNGLYSGGNSTSTWSRRHGRYRGWVKTDAQGRYVFYTFRPAAYPGGREAEHIHLTIKEATTNAYYVDDFVFDDDPLLTTDKRDRMNDRAGSGIVTLTDKEGILLGERDLILGLNIPDY